MLSVGVSRKVTVLVYRVFHGSVMGREWRRIFLKNTKRRSVFFSNQSWLSIANTESIMIPFQIKDAIFELGRKWQDSANAFEYVPLILSSFLSC